MDILPLIFGGIVILAALLIWAIMVLLEIQERLGMTNKILFRVWKLLKNIVVSVTVVSVKVENASYDHGDTVNISGDVKVDDAPLPNTTVGLVIKDVKDAEYPLPDTTTDADGKFTAAWTIPPEVAPGVVTLTASASGMTATTTFTLQRPHHTRKRH